MKTLLLLLVFGGDCRDLGSDDFMTRHRAESRLTRYDWLALPVLPVNDRDPERRRRARRVAARAVRIDRAPLLWDPAREVNGWPCNQVYWGEDADPIRVPRCFVDLYGHPEEWMEVACFQDRAGNWVCVYYPLADRRRVRWCLQQTASSLVRAGIPRPAVEWVINLFPELAPRVGVHPEQ